MPRWNTPLDPECPEVQKFSETMSNDPMVDYSGVGDELWEDFHKKHQGECERCREYGAANIEVV